MPYQAEISRPNPTLMLFVIDQSYSMNDQQGGPDGPQGRKAENLAKVLNRILNELILRCTKGSDIYRYFQIGVIGYTTDRSGKTTKIQSALGGPLAHEPLNWIDVVADNPMRVEQRKKKIPDGVGGLIEVDINFPTWIEPVAEGGTPMCAALKYTYDLLGYWIGQHPQAYPPVVIHITDGESGDGNPSSVAANIRNLATSDGNVLLFNLHLSERMVAPTLFPNSPSRLPDDYARMLYQMSSVMPPPFIQAAQEMQIPVEQNSRAFAFNADLSATIRFIEIGTRQTSQQLR
jgi:hypothetical protein